MTGGGVGGGESTASLQTVVGRASSVTVLLAEFLTVGHQALPVCPEAVVLPIRPPWRPFSVECSKARPSNTRTRPWARRPHPVSSQPV